MKEDKSTTLEPKPKTRNYLKHSKSTNQIHNNFAINIEKQRRSEAQIQSPMFPNNYLDNLESQIKLHE